MINMTERKWNADENFNVWEIQPTKETTTSSTMIKEDLEEVTANGLGVMKEMGIKITPKKRFNIVKSKLIENAHVIEDKEKQFTFPTLVGNDRGLIAYEKALNKLSEENELKGDFRNIISEDIVRIKNENEQLKKEVKKI